MFANCTTGPRIQIQSITILELDSTAIYCYVDYCQNLFNNLWTIHFSIHLMPFSDYKTKHKLILTFKEKRREKYDFLSDMNSIIDT